ncbi:MAG: hypothetical protein ABI857_04545 [Acidobacteriota bacterium]
MKLYRSVAVVIFLSTLFSASCAKTPPPSSSAGALTVNSALAARPFARQTLNAAGSNYLNEYLLPEVRARLDEEPVGDADSDYDPAAIDLGTSSSDQPMGESPGEGQTEEAQQSVTTDNDESFPTGSRLDTLKYSWAKKAFGEAVNASPENTGVIVLYVDEYHYDVERLTRFVEEGRNRIAEMSNVGGERIQVVFGGYRAVPQVELWIVPPGGPMPEFKADDRSKPGDTER